MISHADKINVGNRTVILQQNFKILDQKVYGRLCHMCMADYVVETEWGGGGLS